MVRTAHPFTGFPEQAVKYLADLARNNDRAWFDSHKKIYEASIVAPALRFAEAMGVALSSFAPSVAAEPRIGGSLFRIHRDTRFSADKSPYKTHVGIRLRDRDTATSSRCTGPLFYVEFDASVLRLGVGVKEFDPGTLDAYRQSVVRSAGARAFKAAMERAERDGHEILGDTLTRVPHTYAGHRDNALLKRKGFFIRQETRLPEELHRPEFVTYCTSWFKPYGALFDGLRRIALEAINE
jgi:uncharacterized protein (TIGR02453 family)